MNTIDDLIPKKIQKDLQDSFSFSTGFGVVFVDVQGNHIGDGSNFCDFCKTINSNRKARQLCYESNKQAIDIALKTGKPSIYICHAGLINIEIPLKLNGRHIGGITAGQVRSEDASRYPKYVGSSNSDLDYTSLDEGYTSIPVLSNQQIEATAKSLEFLTNYIVQMNNTQKIREELHRRTSELHEAEKNRLNLEKEVLLSKYTALEKQIMPHFMFNVLNSISRLISSAQYVEANDLLLQFSSMLRYLIKSDDSVTRLEDELKFVSNYLEIQKKRDPERLNYSLEVDSTLLDLPIPYFTLQPFVENSLKHGFKNIDYTGIISIMIREESGLQIIIKDNGIGIEKNILERIQWQLEKNMTSPEFVGITNTISRLKLLYKDNFNYGIESSSQCGTEIVMNIKI